MLAKINVALQNFTITDQNGKDINATKQQWYVVLKLHKNEATRNNIIINIYHTFISTIP